jgi:hypothetical protein
MDLPGYPHKTNLSDRIAVNLLKKHDEVGISYQFLSVLISWNSLSVDLLKKHDEVGISYQLVFLISGFA